MTVAPRSTEAPPTPTTAVAPATSPSTTSVTPPLLPALTPRRSRLVHAHDTEPPPASEEVRAELQGELDKVHRTGEELCHLIGMTSTWGAARWEAGPTNDTLVPTYRVAVRGHVPDEATTELLVQRLARQHWSGAVLSHEPILRLDAHRETFAMRFTAEGSTVRLAVMSPPVQLGRTLSTWVLAGVYEDDEIA
jgi:hypothetical protein